MFTLTKEDFKDLFLTYYHPLCLFAMKIVQRREDAEDIVHNIFLSLWEKKISFSDELHLKAFLFRATYNQAINHVNHSDYIERILREKDQEIIDERNYLRNRIETEVFMEVSRAMEKLPKKCREVVRLSYFEGLKVTEVAHRLRISEDTVKTQRTKGRRILQEILRHLMVWF